MREEREVDQSLGRPVLELLKGHPNQVFTSRELLAEQIVREHSQKFRRKRTESVGRLKTEAALVVQLCAEIGPLRVRIKADEPRIITTLDRPRKWEFRTDATPEGRLTTANGTGLAGHRYVT
jgi:hypothetical protein